MSSNTELHINVDESAEMSTSDERSPPSSITLWQSIVPSHELIPSNIRNSNLSIPIQHMSSAQPDVNFSSQNYSYAEVFELVKSVRSITNYMSQMMNETKAANLNLQTQLQSMTERCKNLEDQLKFEKDKHNTMMQQGNDQLKSLTFDREHTENQFKNLQKQLEQSNIEIHKLKNLLVQLRKNNESEILKSSKLMSSMTSQYKENFEQWETEKMNLNKCIQEQDSQIKKFTENIENFKTENTEIREKILQNEKIISDLKFQKNDLESQYESELGISKAQIQSLKDQQESIEFSQKLFEQKKLDFQKNTEQTENLRHEISQLKSEILKINKENETETEKLNIELTTLRDENQNNIENCEKFCKEIEKLTEENTEIKFKLECTEKDNNFFKVEQRSDIFDFKNSQKKYDRFQQEKIQERWESEKPEFIHDTHSVEQKFDMQIFTRELENMRKDLKIQIKAEIQSALADNHTDRKFNSDRGDTQNLTSQKFVDTPPSEKSSEKSQNLSKQSENISPKREFVDKSLEIERFYGDDTQSVRQWIRQIKRVVKCRGWDTRTAVNCAIAALNSTALELFDSSVKTDPKNLDELEDILIKQYGQSDSYIACKEQFESVKQEFPEPVNRFNQRYAVHLQRYENAKGEPLSEKTKTYQYIHKALAPDLAMVVQKLKPDTLEQAFTLAAEHEPNVRFDRTRTEELANFYEGSSSKQTNFKKRQNNFKSRNQNFYSENRQFKNSEKNDYRQKSEHIWVAKNDNRQKKELFCKFCQKKGHSYDDCYTRKRKQNSRGDPVNRSPNINSQ